LAHDGVVLNFLGVAIAENEPGRFGVGRSRRLGRGGTRLSQSGYLFPQSIDFGLLLFDLLRRG